MTALLSKLYRGRYIIRTMLIKEIKARYAGSALGLFWVVATPLYQILLYTLLFGVVLKVRFGEEGGTTSFVIYLLAGLIPWIFFSEATTRGISTFLDYAHIIKKVNFPMEVTVITTVLSSMFTFFIYMVFYAVVLLVLGVFKPVSLLYILLPLTIQVVLTVGLSYGLGSIAVFFRDVIQIVNMVLHLLFFLTPIMYPISIIPDGLRWLFRLNPFYFIIEGYRKALVQGAMQELTMFIYPALLAIAVFLAGSYIFNRTRDAIKDTL